jgi:hypothetical protein
VRNSRDCYAGKAMEQAVLGPDSACRHHAPILQYEVHTAKCCLAACSAHIELCSPSFVMQESSCPRLHLMRKPIMCMCSSLLFKGAQLEPALGSTRFALLISELWLSGSAMYCGLLWGAHKALGHRSPRVARFYRNNVLVGFSGMLPGILLQDFATASSE